MMQHMPMDSSQRAKAERLRSLHLDDELLVLVNVWDAASARTVAAVPGCPALATASWAIAAAHGLPDGEAISRDAMIEAVETVTSSVELPVSADLEMGYGDAAETVAAAVAAGAVGCNLEDAAAGGGGLVDLVRQADAIAAVRAREPEVVINARTDVFLKGIDDVGQALERGRAYLDAGADCVFVPGAGDAEVIRSLVTGMGGPVSLLAAPGSVRLDELASLGVARVTFGPGLMGAAMAAVRDAATVLLERGAYPDALRFRPGA